MVNKKIAQQVLDAVGGVSNILANGLCATRLRVILRDRMKVNYPALTSISGVLGSVRRGSSGLEVVFGPSAASDVFNAFAELTGLDNDSLDATQLGDPESVAMKVQVSKGAKRSFAAQSLVSYDAASDDSNALAEMLDAMPGGIKKDEGPKLLVINGPNINMLGIREPGIYGNKTYADLTKLCHDAAAEFGFTECRCMQSNHQGDLIDAIQGALDVYDAIAINPAAYTHTSIALLDALKAVGIPAVEVHISKLEEREDFRQTSYVRDACIATVSGEGIEGYRSAVRILAEHLGLDQ